MKYNKLVRDKIPEIIKEKGKNPTIHKASDDEYWIKLKEKLKEEVDEFLEDSNEEELADILEIIDAICNFKKIDKNELEKIRKSKKEEKGGFKGRVILDEVKQTEEIINNLSELLEKSIKKIPKKEKIGLLLSGGIDSSIIAVILKKLEYNFICYTAEFYHLNFKEAEDIKYVQFLTKKIKLSSKIVKVNLKEIEESIPKVMKIIKSNNVTMVGIALPIYFCMKKAKSDKTKIILYDSALDCLFAGLHKHRNSKNLNKACLDSLEKAHKIDFPRDKKIAKYFGIKLKSPFLNNQLISFAMSLSKRYKINQGVNKYILRKTAVKIGVPKDIAFRKKNAIQYSSNFQKALRKISKQHGFKKIHEYLKSKN